MNQDNQDAANRLYFRLFETNVPINSTMFIAHQQDVTIGIVEYEVLNETCRIVNLGICENFRRKGHGQALIEFLK